MAVETKVYCDFCGKEMYWQGRNFTVTVFAAQGNQSKADWGERSWKHKARWDYCVCEECAGEKVIVNFGDTPHFNLGDKAKTFLRRIGFIKHIPEPEEK